MFISRKEMKRQKMLAVAAIALGSGAIVISIATNSIASKEINNLQEEIDTIKPAMIKIDSIDEKLDTVICAVGNCDCKST